MTESKEIHPTINRLESILDELKMRRIDFLTKHGIESQKYNNWRSRGIPQSKIHDIAIILGVKYEYLRNGIGERFIKNNHYQVKPQSHEHSVQEVSTTNFTEGPKSKGQVPLISWVQAGDWCEAIDLFEVGDAERWLPCPVTHSDKTFILRVQGSSMEPEYRDGDLIFVDPDAQAGHNSDIVIRLESANTATFKRLQIVGEKQYLSPINKEWPEPVIHVTEHAQICGVVIFSGRLR